MNTRIIENSIYILLILISSVTLHSQNISNSIDTELLELDIDEVKSGYYKDLNIPLSIGAFGVKPYPGSGGAIDIDIKLRTKQFVGASFAIGQSDEAKKHYTFQSSHVAFCNIVVLTDFYDPIEYSHHSNLVTSRNHPNYLGIGTVKITSQQIDYVTFTDVSSETMNSYSIISGKLFNLKSGNSILVIPQKDLSLKFIQFNLENSNFDDINDDLKKEISKVKFRDDIFDIQVIGN